MTQLLYSPNPVSRGWLNTACAALLAVTPAHAVLGETPGASPANPASGDVARLCVAHGRYCDCPGCRAYYQECETPCPPGAMVPSVIPDSPEFDESGEPLTTPPAEAAEPEPMSGPMPAMSSNLTAIAAATSASPGMIGDFFGGGYQYTLAPPLNGATVAVAAGDRVMKFADNNNPMPQDRLFFNYHLFSDPVTDVNGVDQDVNRFTFGFEKTCWSDRASFEFRIPFAVGVDSTQAVGQTTDTVGAEFGNLALAVKTLLCQGDYWAVSGGLGIIFPTAEDASIFNDSGQRGVTFFNESYFLQPFLGVYAKPSTNLFTQFVTQVNFDVSGSVVSVEDPSFFGDVGSDRIFEQPLLFLDYSMGYWLYQTKRCDIWVTGIAPMIEIHYSTTLKDLELPEIGSGSSTIFDPDFRRDALNLTGGVLFALGQQTSLRLAGVAPLRNENLMFDAEFGLQLIRRY